MKSSPQTPLLSTQQQSQYSTFDKIYDVEAHVKRLASTYSAEAIAISKTAWKVSVATLCRTLLPAITAAFLGHLGSKELAASALANVWVSGLQTVIYGFSVSLCTLCGQAFGAKNYELVGIWFQLGVVSLTVISIPMCISFYYVDYILCYVTDDAQVLALATLFSRYSILSVWPQCFNCALRQYLQAQEIVTPGTVVSSISVVLCILANYLFIYKWDYGFVGSPIAQFVADAFQPLALVAHACAYRKYHKKTWFGWTWACVDPERVRRFTWLSFTMTLNVAMDEWIYSAITAVAGSIGPLDLAANSILYTLWNLVYSIYWGFGLPTQVRVANFLGAKQPHAAQQTMRVGFVLGGIAAFGSAGLFYSFMTPILAFFTPDPQLTLLIKNNMLLFGIAVGLSGLHIVLASVLEAMSKAKTLLCITGTGSWGVMFPLSYLLGITANLGLSGLWIGSICGEFAKFILVVWALQRINWRRAARKAASEAGHNHYTEEEVAMARLSVGTATPSMFSPVISRRMNQKDYELTRSQSENDSESNDDELSEIRPRALSC
ncbi:Multidrug/Oligosaccharidyl-lipid/Polysaccharide (MOP) Flippase Superfamily [Thraustotheca clavata]|uniref:Multidrug/Oligosaccharidyl-lipid/Polysaccharide (MOP) Flippase Superfamily n=1 Tax=Thraustotheca clavata TaxID=74557 RepID=A0A1V9Y7H6_9STRA|nr:Multidrug/Oligosaccharidyl-lipid/Polysaccharide (MOP) Flippase Superfamily [Thraustotheca clavata]